MTNYFCEYCGTKASSLAGLANNSCFRHPNGAYKGMHKLYEGNEKTQYFCKFCGLKAYNITILTSSICSKHPNGAYKGKHSPAL